MHKFILYLSLLFSITSCVSYDNYYKLDRNYLQNRQNSTKTFNIVDKSVALNSIVYTLQDLGFNIDESESSFGIITASKSKRINSIPKAVGIIALSTLFGTDAVYDVKQKIYVTISIQKNNNGFIDVRATFAEITWNNLDQSRMETLNGRDIYRSFFDKLEQSLFLLKNNI